MELTIPNSSDTSNDVELFGKTRFNLVFPAAMTGTSITIQSESVPGSYEDLHDDDGNPVTVTFAANRPVGLTKWRETLASCHRIRLKSNATELAARTFTLRTK